MKGNQLSSLIIYLSSMTKNVIIEYSRRIRKSNLSLPKPSILLAFGIIKNPQYELITRYNKLIDKVFLDSGAWTLNKAKGDYSQIITLPGYIACCKNLVKHVDLYANFDSNFNIDGFDENMSNMLEMEKAGLKPVPVVHNYHGKEIDFYIKRGHRDVALGSYVGRNIYAITYASKKLAQHNVNTHLFAKSSYFQLRNLPVRSSDSSSWTQNVRFGCIPYWNPSKPGVDKTDVIYFHDERYEKKLGRNYWGNYRYQNELEEFLDTNLGIKPNHLLGTNGNLYQQVVNVLYYVQIQKMISDSRVC